ncbi:jg19473 [Pararge aegeria aegeria]|uniref:Jg19473 protein n=1 Tax=Pararge aegeria aegeria TaxID=348720 RepID=A0A8S4R7K3_9NEOP|nr:jg19473 [Pararge aegeria aegeria]
MFVSHDMKSKKKPKPNILRKKPVLNKCLVHTLGKPESQDIQSLLTSSFVLDPKKNQLEEHKTTNYANHVYPIDKSEHKVDDEATCNTQDSRDNVYVNNSLIYFNTSQQNDIELSQNQTVNEEPFLLGDLINQNENMVFERDTNKDIEKQGKHKWCFNFIQDPETIIIKQIVDTEPGLLGYAEQNPVVTLTPQSEQSSEPTILQNDNLTPVNYSQTLSIKPIINLSPKFKCDIPDCNKEYRSKQILKKHMSVHSKDNTAKPQRQINVECPVKRIHENGDEEPCGRIFNIREELMKHLNEDHTIDEALYRWINFSNSYYFI